MLFVLLGVYYFLFLGGLQVLQNFILQQPFVMILKGNDNIRRKDFETYEKIRFLAIQALHTLATSSPIRRSILSQACPFFSTY